MSHARHGHSPVDVRLSVPHRQAVLVHESGNRHTQYLPETLPALGLDSHWRSSWPQSSDEHCERSVQGMRFWPALRGVVSVSKSHRKKKKKNGMERARRALAGRVVAAVRPAHTRDAQHGAPGAGDRAGNGVENGTRRNVRAEASRDAIQRNGPSQGPNRCPGGAPRASRKVRGAKCAWERERDRARART